MNATTMQCVQALALYMQRGFMQGIAYGAEGFPNMQSLLELSEMSSEEAFQAIAQEPAIMQILKNVVLKGDAK